MRGYNARCRHDQRAERGMYTSIAGDATETGAGNCAVSALPRLEPSHRLVCTEPWVIRSIRHSRESKVRSLGSSVSVDRSDLLRFVAVTRWAAGQV
jgi:hypothetical protein